VSDRQRESNDYLNRRYDQTTFERGQAQRSQAVSGAIATRNWPAAYRALGIPPSRWPDSDADRTEPAEPPSLHDQFTEHRAKLIDALQSVRLLPADVIQARVERVRAIRFFLPSEGLLAVKQMLAEYDTLYRRYEPRPDIFDLQIDQSIRFFYQMTPVKFELQDLERILTEAESTLKLPFGFPLHRSLGLGK
jgi:hypothetical protein